MKLLSHSQFTKSQDMQVWRAIAGKAVSYITALSDYSVLFLYPPRKNNVFFVTHSRLCCRQESVVTETNETEPDGFYVFAQLADQESFFAASYRTLFFYTLEFDVHSKN